VTSAPESPGRLAGLIAINVTAVLFGAIALFGRIEASPVWIVAGRMAFAALVLAAVGAVRRTLVRPRRRHLAPAAVSGALLALHWITFFWSAKAGGVAIATLTVSAFPLFTILIDAARLRKAPAAVEVIGCLAIMIAIALIARPDAQSPGIMVGTGAGLASAALFSFYSLASRRLMDEVGPLNLSLAQYVLACLMLAPALAFFRPVEGAGSWVALAALGVFGTALSFQLYLFALTRLPASVCGGFVCLEPIYAIVLAALIFHEPVTPMVIVSAAIIVAASLALLRWSKGPAPEPGVL
jgi:drug/metabolite transporter (DMT)-like permease